MTTPAPLIHRPIDTLQALGDHLQLALGVELSTIPPYLCALYSISEPASEASRLIRGVVIEEMLHMMQVANLMNAIGCIPSLEQKYVPTYPSNLLGHTAGGPFIQLQPLSPALARTVFMRIEQPEPGPDAPAEDEPYDTIGQFYKAIELGFVTCVERFGEKGVFGQDTGFQRDDTYIGPGGGELHIVHDLDGAKAAIMEIVQQGEGALIQQPPAPYEEPYGGYDHYGERLDGTYGPIIGTPWELSHYRRFQRIAEGEVSLPPIYPMQANPSDADLGGDFRRLSHLFDNLYTLVLVALGEAFGRTTAPRPFFQTAFPVMQAALPALATLLMRTPLNPAADPALGPTAGPAFVYRPLPVADIVAEAAGLLARPPSGLGGDYRLTWRHNLGIVHRTLSGVLAADSSFSSLHG
ncbi:ferritin-like domain-containing protein [Nonomuraea rhizosphaerae]|uniref:ferritin-like domain-containing protein n=1 Tax=Nonomuraea rhizosphaerae TaxID=2665663 RepID=UPI001C5FCC19|nr:ferritin-like protein [Nonomuraea rhizosphaerae]